jgi:hypothetical protein
MNLETLLLSNFLLLSFFISWAVLDPLFPKTTNSLREAFNNQSSLKNQDTNYENQLKHQIHLLEKKVKELTEVNYNLQRNDWGTCIYLMEKYEKCFVCENSEDGSVLKTKIIKK